MKKGILALIVCLLLSKASIAQDMIKHVPADAGLVMEINLNALKGHLGDKMSSLDKKMGMTIFQYKSMPFATLFSSEKSGVDMNKKAYFFIQGENLFWVLPIANENLFKTKVKQLAQESRNGEETQEYSFTNSNGADVLFIENHGVVVKDGIAILSTAERKSTYFGGSYQLKRDLKDYMRAQGVTNDEEEVSAAMKTKIKELIAKHEKESLENDGKDEVEKIYNDYSYPDEEGYYYDPETIEMTDGEAEEAAEDAAEEAVEGDETEVIMDEAIDADEEITIDAYEDEAAEEIPEIIEYEDEMLIDDNYDLKPIEKPKPYKSYTNYKWDHPVLQAFDEEWDKYKARRRANAYIKQNQEMTAKAVKFIQYQEQNSILSNNQFKNGFSQSHDMGVWVSETMPFYYSRMMSRGLRGLNWGAITSMFKGNHGAFYLDVKDQSITFTGNQYVGEEFAKYKTMVSKKVNKKFIKYLPKSTFGVYAMNVNHNEIYDMYLDIYKRVMQSMDAKRGMDLSGTVDLFDMFINKDMLLNTFSGDGIVALTGNTQIISTKRRYLFDSNTYSRSWQTVPDTNSIPEMVTMFTIKNKANLERLLAALVKLKVLGKSGNTYFIDMDYGYTYRKNDPKKTMWTLGMEGNIFYISNSQSIQLNQGLVKHNAKKDMSQEICSLLKKEGNFFYWDHVQGMNSFSSIDMGSRKMLSMTQISSEYFKGAKMVSKKTGKNSYSFNASFRFDEENKGNALLQVMEMFQRMDERH